DHSDLRECPGGAQRAGGLASPDEAVPGTVSVGVMLGGWGRDVVHSVARRRTAVAAALSAAVVAGAAVAVAVPRLHHLSNENRRMRDQIALLRGEVEQQFVPPGQYRYLESGEQLSGCPSLNRTLPPTATVTYDPPHAHRQTATVRTLDAAGTGSTTTMTFEHNGRDLFLVAEGIQSVRQGTPLDKFTLADGSRVHTVGPGVRNAAWTLRGGGDRRVTNTVEVDALQDQVTLGD